MSQPKPIASWSPDLDCWTRFDDETESLFSVPSVVFSETFPTSGMTVAGTAYALPSSERRTDDSACSLLPTPAAQEPGGTAERHLWRKNRLDGANRTTPTHLAFIDHLLRHSSPPPP